ncbi:MAG TPA: decarboxylating 6-phosphogluconate dehydrogenase [Phototrophicaceae bacterium]|nr:decarboxylating 6-phosphogluconate dehydrogenase [Phototrophicaceae bacterium]
MQLGLVGLGKMGGNMNVRLLQGGHSTVVYNRTPEPVQAAVDAGSTASTSLADLVSKLSKPRAIWLMIPAGDPTESSIQELMGLLEPGDTIIDGGNSNYKDSIRHAELVKPKGINFVDVGTSGGVWGLKEGYSMMVGGDKEVVDRLSPIFQTLAPASDQGWGYVGPSGAGHFVKMVHNGIEYGLMQAYAEGFEIMKSKTEMNLDLYQISEIWRYGSVVRSWLLDLIANALQEDQNLTHIKPWVADSGEGRWTVAEAIDHDVPAPVITMSLLMRFVSRQDDSYAAKLLAATRNQFGGHEVKHE